MSVLCETPRSVIVASVTGVYPEVSKAGLYTLGITENPGPPLSVQ